MNNSGTEQQLKKLLEGETYLPTDMEWSRIQDALNPAPSKNILLLFPYFKIAAFAAAVIVLGGGLLSLFREKDPENKMSVTSRTKKENNTIARALAGEDTSGHHKVTVAKATSINNNTFIYKKVFQNPVTDTLIIHKSVASNIPKTDVPPLPDEHKVNNSGSLLKTNVTGKYSITDQNINTSDKTKDKSNINLGLAANIGKPVLGNVQYNIGVVVRQNITSQIFAEANVSLATTQVTYSEQIKPPPNIGGSSDIITPINATYASSLLAIGFAPSLGFKATNNISLLIGGDLYKSINRNVRLQEQDAGNETYNIAKAREKNIADWDAGLKAQLDYKLGRRFSVNTQYRRGLTQYMLIDGKSFKNSNFNIGFRYYLNK